MSVISRLFGIRNAAKIFGVTCTPDTTEVRAYRFDKNGNVVEATGSTVPSDNESGYAVGALFFDTDASSVVTYVNEGTTADCDFNPVVTNKVQDRTATTTGATTGTIAAGVTHVTVTSDDANKIIILPAPVVGHKLTLHVGATGFELRSSAPATIAINGGSGANAESAIPANSTVEMICVSATAWKGYFMDADGDVAKVEAAA